MANREPTDIDRNGVLDLMKRGGQVVDVLTSEEYSKSHIAGAVNIPLKQINRSTADRLDWNQQVIVYCYDYQCDLSSRAAWRLIQLGFTQVFRYKPGKMDWLANGLPFEGEDAAERRVGDLAHMDVPTCRITDRVEEIRRRLPEGWDTCAVVNEEWVVMGLLRPEALRDGADQTAEQVMDPDVRTFRLNGKVDKALDYMRRHDVEFVLVTSVEGRLFGLLRKKDLEEVEKAEEAARSNSR